MSVVAVVLAAGRGSRFAEADAAAPLKLLVPLDGVPLICRTVSALVAAEADRAVVVVAREHAVAIAGALAAWPVMCVVNPAPDQGMFSSIQCGVVAAADAAVCLLIPGDMPFVRPATMAQLMAEARTGIQGQTIVPRHGGRTGHPVVCSASLRARILSADVTTRLDHLMESEDVRLVDVDDPGVLRDVDVPSDLAPADQS